MEDDLESVNRSRSTVFSSEPLVTADESRTASTDGESLREPQEYTRLGTEEFDFHASDLLETGPTLLVKYDSPTGAVSWTLLMSVGDPEDDDDTSARIHLQNVRAERLENLCVKLEVLMYDGPTKGQTFKKLLRADGVLVIADENREMQPVSFRIRVSTHYRCAPCGPCADWARLRGMHELAEVTFKVGDVAMPAHKQALCARSPVFRSMFTLGFKEAQEMVVHVEDVPCPEAFDKFLEYIYSGQVQDFEQMELQVLLIADRYQVEGLKSLCEMEMFDKMNAANVLSTLVLADKVNARLLKKNALLVAVNKIGEVMASPAWKDFHQKHNGIVDDMLKEAILRNVST